MLPDQLWQREQAFGVDDTATTGNSKTLAVHLSFGLCLSAGHAGTQITRHTLTQFGGVCGTSHRVVQSTHIARAGPATD